MPGTSPSWVDPANRWFATHHGVIAIRTLVEYGASRSTVQKLIERGVVVPILPGIVRSTHHPHGPLQSMVAAS